MGSVGNTRNPPPNTQGKAGRTRKPQPAKRSNWERAESQQGLHCGEANPNCYSRGESSTCDRGNPYGPQFSKVAPCLLTEIQTDKKQIVMMDSVSHIKPPSDRFWPRLRQNVQTRFSLISFGLRQLACLGLATHFTWKGNDRTGHRRPPARGAGD